MKVSRFSRAVSVLAAISLIIPILSFRPVEKVRADYDGAYRYTVQNDGTALITYFDASSAGYEGYLLDLVIPSTLGGHKVSAIGQNVFKECFFYKSITIPEGVVSIGDYAFYYIDTCKTISFPSTLKTIGKYAFALCMELEEARLPKGLQSVGSCAFYNDHVCDVYYYSSTAVQDDSFYNCNSVNVIANGTPTTPTPTNKPNTPTPTKATTVTPTKKPSNTPTNTPRATSTPKPTSTTRPTNTPKPTAVPTLKGYVTKSGKTIVGETLTVTVTDCNCADSSLIYTWQTGGSNNGFYGKTYVVRQADVGKTIVCIITDSTGTYTGQLKATFSSGVAPTNTPTPKQNTPTPTKKVNTPTPTKKPTNTPTTKPNTPTPTQKVNTPTPTQKVNTPTPTKKPTNTPTTKPNTPTPTKKVNTPTPTKKVNTPTNTPTRKPTVQPTLGGYVTKSGKSIVGETLTVNVSDSNCADSNLKYTWQTGGSNNGFFGKTYVVRQADIGKTIVCIITDSTGTYTGQLKATFSAGAAPTNTPTPKGNTPTPTKKVNTPTPTKKPTNTPTTKPNTPTPTTKVNTPTPTKKVNTPTNTPTKKPTVQPTLSGYVTKTGKPIVGQTLTVNISDSNCADSNLKYTWQTGGSNNGYFGKTYVVRQADVGKSIVCIITDSTGTFAGQLKATFSSATTPTPTATPKVNTPTPTKKVNTPTPTKMPTPTMAVVKMPDVVGMHYEDAKQTITDTLRAGGFTYPIEFRITWVSNLDYEKTCKVQKQDPTAGTYIYGNKALTVDLYVAEQGITPTPTSIPKPGKPSNVSATAVSGTKVNVSWNKVANATGYAVYRSTSKDGTYTRLGTVTTTSRECPGLTSWTTYYFKVRAYRTVNGTTVYGPYSEAVSATPISGVPTNVKTKVISATKVNVSWTEISGATGYEVFRSTSENGTYSKLGVVTTTNRDCPGLTTGTTYYFKVRAYKEVDGVKLYGGFSKVVSAVPKPTAPTNVKVKVVSSSKVNVSWKGVEGATGYEVYRSTSKDGTYSKLGTVTTTNRDCPGLSSGTTYYFKVRAYKEVNGTKIYSSFSTIVSATPN